MELDKILLTGRPGIGKTTVIVGVAELLEERRLAGFYTEELREKGGRTGFTVTTLSGGSTTLAHVNIKSPHRVGPYRVDVPAFQQAALPEFSRPCDLLLIDEIGKMECFSRPFVDAVRRAFENDTPIVATVAVKGRGFIAEVKARTDVDIIEVTESNRDRLPHEIAERVAKTC